MLFGKSNADLHRPPVRTGLSEPNSVCPIGTMLIDRQKSRSIAFLYAPNLTVRLTFAVWRFDF